MSEREGLVARIRRARRATVDPQADRGTRDDRVDALEARLRHVEQQLEGLQDSVHRESERHGKLIAELQAQTQPGAMGAALAENARSRGL